MAENTCRITNLSTTTKTYSAGAPVPPPAQLPDASSRKPVAMEKFDMKMKVAIRLLTIFGCLMMLPTSSPWAFAQQWSMQHNAVLIHGRRDSSAEQFGVF